MITYILVWPVCHYDIFWVKMGMELLNMSIWALSPLTKCRRQFSDCRNPSHKLRLLSFYLFFKYAGHVWWLWCWVAGRRKWGWDSNRMRFRREGPHHLLVKQPVWQASGVCCYSRLMFPVSNGACHDNSGSSMRASCTSMEPSALFIQLGQG